MSDQDEGLTALVNDNPWAPKVHEHGEQIMEYFQFQHLPPALQEVSGRFSALAYHLLETLPRCAERTAALRKLLEGKDAAVRAALTATQGAGVPPR